MITHDDYLRAAYSDSDSEWSSLERQRVTDVLGKANKKPSTHKRIRKKRTAIPVATPKVPLLASMVGSGDGIVGLNYNMKDDKNWRIDPADRGMNFFYIYWYSFLVVYNFALAMNSDSVTTYLSLQCPAKRLTVPTRVIRNTLRGPDRNSINMRRLVCGKDSPGTRCSNSTCNILSM